MTLVNIDLKNAGYETGPDDRVIFYSLLVREGEFGTISTAPVEVPLVDGKGSRDLAPGPVGVQIIAGQVVDTRIKVGEVPPSGPTTLNAVMMVTPAYTPALQAAMIAAIERARDESLSDVDRATAAALAAGIKPLQDAAAAAQLSAQEAAHGAISAAESADSSAGSAAFADGRASSAETQATQAISRVEALEAMGGVSPESPVDGQQANLILQPDSLTRGALVSAHQDFLTATTDSLITDADLITETGWTLGTGWSGTLQTGFVHTPPGGGALEWALPALAVGSTYLLEVEVSGFAVNNNFPGDLSIDIAGVSLHPIYRGVGKTTQAYQRAFIPKNSDPLSITVKASTPARVTEVELVRVSGSIPATATWRDPQGDPAIELRTNGNKSVFLGLEAGQRHQGDTSVGIGAGALRDDVTGFFNVAVGMDALKLSRRVSRNVAIGYQSLAENLGGDRNVAVGPFAGHRISTGNENTLLGVDTLWQSFTGSRNIAVGLYAMSNADSSDQVAIGNSALRYATSGEHNIAIGAFAMNQASAGTGNVAVGRAALNKNTGDANVAVGNLASYQSNGSYNVAVGTEALHGGQSATPTNTVAIGHRAGTAVTSGARNTLVGYSAGYKLTTGNSNTVIGNLSGENLTTGANNIILGHMAGGGLSIGHENIIIGGAARSDNPNVSGHINIGNVLYGSRSTGNVGIGVEVPNAVLHLKASTGDPGTAPLRFNAGPLVPTPVSGAMEFDGSKLYITISGVRREIALVTPEPTP